MQAKRAVIGHSAWDAGDGTRHRLGPFGRGGKNCRAKLSYDQPDVVLENYQMQQHIAVTLSFHRHAQRVPASWIMRSVKLSFGGTARGWRMWES